MEPKKFWEKKNKAGDIILPDFKFKLQSCINQNALY